MKYSAHRRTNTTTHYTHTHTRFIASFARARARSKVRDQNVWCLAFHPTPCRLYVVGVCLSLSYRLSGRLCVCVCLMPMNECSFSFFCTCLCVIRKRARPWQHMYKTQLKMNTNHEGERRQPAGPLGITHKMGTGAHGGVLVKVRVVYVWGQSLIYAHTDVYSICTSNSTNGNSKKIDKRKL